MRSLFRRLYSASTRSDLPAGSSGPWLSASLLLLLPLGLIVGCGLIQDSAGIGQGASPSPPPQYLPITAQWCLAPALVVDPGLLPGDATPQASPLSRTAPRDAAQGTGRCIQLEVPAGSDEFRWGLQMRPPLPPLRGMWFNFILPTRARFWMHRTPSPLDMIFIREGKVIHIEARVPPCMDLPCPSYGPDQLSDGVVELRAGQAEALGIEVGTPASITPLKAPPPSGGGAD